MRIAGENTLKPDPMMIPASYLGFVAGGEGGVACGKQWNRAKRVSEQIQGRPIQIPQRLASDIMHVKCMLTRRSAVGASYTAVHDNCKGQWV